MEKKMVLREEVRKDIWGGLCVIEGYVEQLKAFVQNEMPLEREDFNKFYLHLETVQSDLNGISYYMLHEKLLK